MENALVPQGLSFTQEILVQVIGSLIFAIIVAIFTYKNWGKIWKYLKWLRLTYFPTPPFNVVFAIETDDSDGNRNHLREIIRNFEQQIEILGLHKYLKVKDFKNVKFFKTRDDAQNYSKSNNIDLLVWGRASGGELKQSGDPSCQMNLRFTYLHPLIGRGNIGQMLAAEINSMLATRQYWQIVDSESLRDTQIISSNLTDVSLYIIGLTMMLFGRIQESINIFEKLLAKNTGKSDTLSEGAREHLINNYEIKLSEFKEDSNDFKIALELSDKLLILDSQNLIGLAAKAVSHVHFEQYNAGEKCVEDLIKYHPTSSVSIIDMSYFLVLKKKYSEAIVYYKKLMDVEFEFNPLNVSKFLEDQYEKNKDPGFLFGSGFVDCNFGDKTLGKKSLRKFLDHEESTKEEYSEMKNIASELLSSNL